MPQFSQTQNGPDLSPIVESTVYLHKHKKRLPWSLNILFSPDTEDMQALQEVKGERGDGEQDEVESVAYS